MGRNMALTKTVLTLAIGGLASAYSAHAAAAAGDPAAGKAIFMRCAVCHSVKAGENRLGPSLAGVVGRKAGTVAGYSYSTAMKGSGVTWTAAELDAFLTNPRAKIPGTKMTFVGLPKPEDRANLIAYLGKPQ